MQTTRQAINNTNHPSSALKASFGPSFPYNMPQNSSSSHMQTTRQEINNTNHLSSSFQPAIQPSFPYNMPENSSPTSSSHMKTTRQAINNTNHLSSSFQPAIRPSFLYDMRQNSSSSSFSLQASVRPNDQDLLSKVEINLADQYEQNLLSEVEIIDGNGNILRTQKMTAKQVYKLKGGEKVLVHVNKDYQLIKNAGGLCSRFMTLILKQPNLCPPDAKDRKECKDSCAAMHIAELRRRFCIPQGESVDKVLSTMFSVKRRTVKYRLKQGLYQQAANKMNEANGINGLDAQEKNYTDDELLAALDLLEPPENFLEHQWRVYKSHLRKPIAKVIVNREISSKVKELVGPEGITEDVVVDNQTKEIHTHKKQLEMCNKELETCKKQLASQNKKVESYKKQVETQGLQMKNMEQKLNAVYGMLKLLPAFPDLDNVASTFTAAGTCDKQPSSSPSPFMDEDHYSPVMEHLSFGY
ncbi:hypothetical protein Tco_0693876 [Tanacetum coccineum]